MKFSFIIIAHFLLMCAKIDTLIILPNNLPLNLFHFMYFCGFAQPIPVIQYKRILQQYK